MLVFKYVIHRGGFYTTKNGFILLGLTQYKIDMKPIGIFQLKLNQVCIEHGFLIGFIPIYQHKIVLGIGFQDGFGNTHDRSNTATRRKGHDVLWISRGFKDKSAFRRHYLQYIPYLKFVMCKI